MFGDVRGVDPGQRGPGMSGFKIDYVCILGCEMLSAGACDGDGDQY